MGSHSGRNVDKIAESGLTPIAVDDYAVIFAESNLTFVCKKIYWQHMDKDSMLQDIKDYYVANPKVYPVNANGEWESHVVFVGEITKVLN